MVEAKTLRVLLVEDENFICEAMCEWLTAYAFEVETASNGAEALRMLAEHRPYDVILLDWVMPHVDGAAFRRRQLAHPAWAKIATLILTGDAGAVTERSQLTGAQLLEKPVDLSTLPGRLRGLATRTRA